VNCSIDWVPLQRIRGELKSGLDLARRLERLWTASLGPMTSRYCAFKKAENRRRAAQPGALLRARELDALVLPADVLRIAYERTVPRSDSLPLAWRTSLVGA